MTTAPAAVQDEDDVPVPTRRPAVRSLVGRGRPRHAVARESTLLAAIPSLVLAVCLALLTVRVAVAPLPSLARPSTVGAVLVALTLVVGVVLCRRRVAAGARLLDDHTVVRRVLVAGATVLSFAAQWRVAYAGRQTAVGWDAFWVEAAAHDLLTDTHLAVDRAAYLITFPNNQTPSALVGGWLRATNGLGLDRDAALTLLPALLVTATAAVTYGTVRRLRGTAAACAAGVVTTLLVGFSPWVAVPYSDSLGVLFPVLAVALLARALPARGRPGPRRPVALLLLAGAGAAVGIGMTIKPTVAVCGIAVMTVLAYKLLPGRRPGLRRRTVVVSAAAFLLGWTSSWVATGWLTTETLALGTTGAGTAVETPVSSWLMTGLSLRHGEDGITYYGAWNQSDYDALVPYATKQERSDAARQVVTERLVEMGPLGYLDFTAAKLTWVFSDATFFAFGEGLTRTAEFTQTDDTSRQIQATVHADGSDSLPWATVLQAAWLLVLLGMSSNVRHLLRPSRIGVGLVQLVLRTTVVGVLLYEAMFEGRSRYLFIFVPLLVLLAALDSARSTRPFPVRRAVPAVPDTGAPSGPVPTEPLRAAPVGAAAPAAPTTGSGAGTDDV